MRIDARRGAAKTEDSTCVIARSDAAFWLSEWALAFGEEPWDACK